MEVRFDLELWRAKKHLAASNVEFQPGHSEERRTERRLIEDYFATIDELLGKLDADNIALAAEIASMPEQIRGYGHVKQAHLVSAKGRAAKLPARWRQPAVVAVAA